MDNLYVNAGTVNSCLFIKMSRHLLHVLKENPLLYFAVEEALLSAKQGWYGIGILAWSQILNALKRPTPVSRHVVAHELLRQRPTKAAFDAALDQLKLAASDHTTRELAKVDDPAAYRRVLLAEWTEFITHLHGEAAVAPLRNAD